MSWCQVNVLTYHNDFARTGQNTNETVLTPANVNVNSFGQMFSYAVDGYVYAQPLCVSGLMIPGQENHNVVFVATEHNGVYAFDADSNAGPNGGLLWYTNLGPSAATPNNDFGNRYGPYHDINPEVGITSTPVIDLSTGTMYLDAFTHEGALYYHRVHALNITNGTEQPYSPVIVSASVPGVGVDSSRAVVTFNAEQSLQRPALTLAGGILFVAYSGYADTDPYHGWVIGFDASNLQQLTNYVFNTTPNSTTATDGPNAGEGGIWMSGNGLAVDANTNLYFEVGNGSFNAGSTGGTEYGDCFVKLSTAGGLSPADWFAPYNQAALAAGDTDLGSGGALLLPDSVGTVGHPHLLVGCGKEGKIYLLDRDNLGHFNAANDNQIVQELPGAVGGTWSSGAYFNRRVYYQGSGDVLKAFSLSNGLLNANPVQSSTSFGWPGATPSISANGTNSAIAWVLQTDGYPAGPSILHAYNAYTLQELYNSTQAGPRDGLANAVKFTVPTIANGKVYVGAQKSLAVFGTGAFLAVPTIAPAGGIFTNSVTVTLTETTPGAALYYTVDNSAPSTNATLYAGPFVLTNTTTLKVQAFKPGDIPSPVVSATFLNSASVSFAVGLVRQDFYSGATRANLEDPAFSTPPTFTTYLGSYETPQGQGNDYAERVSGYFIPPQTTNYVFFVCSDDDSDLFLSTDDTPLNKHLIATEASWSNSREWLSSAGGSDPTAKRSDQFAGTAWPNGNTISLNAGSRYYIEAVHHQGVGGDNFAAFVKQQAAADPANGDASDLAGDLIATYAFSNSFITITAQPQDAVAVQGSPAIFNVSAVSGSFDIANPPPAILYQWQSAPSGSTSFTNIPFATSPSYTAIPQSLAANGMQFRVVLTTAGFVTNSTPASISVVGDVTPPWPVQVQSIDPSGTILTVAFSEPLASLSAQTLQNYLFSPGNIVPVSAALDATGTNLTLTMNSSLPRSVLLTLSITGLADRAGNVVAPGTSISFMFQTVTYETDILFDQPIAYYRFEEPAGTTVATNLGSAGGNGAYYVGDEPSPGAGGSPSAASGDPGPRPPAYAGFEASNHAATFDGASRWVDTRNQFLQDQSAFTLEYWVAPTNRVSFPGRVGIVGQNDAVEYGFIDANTIQVWTPNGGSLNTSFSFPDGEWHHVATIADGSSIHTYYDGVLKGSAVRSTSDYGSSVYNVHIGGGGVFDSFGNWFHGRIDEVAIFDRAIPASRVAEHYRAGKSGGLLLTNQAVTPVASRFTSIALVGNQVALQWFGTGQLEEASDLTGPWSLSGSQGNPQVVPSSGGRRFYRLR
ncbi:MAG TPA: LamG-like jellyroll fold domain-containing protein [Patescibacteria group bacterium]|nr:LamG-like jellyroll fold domain-containing protein [Patescibacteria group bacterium]